MALSIRLEVRQSQSLVMTPQLQQAIKLLQFSNLELTSYIEQEVEKNPLLDMAGPADTDGPAEPSGIDEPPAADPGPEQDSGFDAPDPVGVDNKLSQPGDGAAREDAPLDTEFDNDFTADGDGQGGGDSLVWSRVSGSGRFDESDNRLDQLLGQTYSLRDYLLDELPGTFADPADQLIGRYLIDTLNADGYLADTIEAVADRMACPLEAAEKVLATLQNLDPPGIFARDLKECLALQLAQKDRLDPVMRKFLDNLDLLAKHDLAALKRVCQVDLEDLRDMVQEVRSLNPKPGAAFSSEPVQPVVPDVFVRKGPDGAWLVELNSETLPRVLVNKRYHARINQSAKTADDKTYITECLTTANWLIKALDQRARTILKVSSEIVRQQEGFLARGVQYLRPLNLRMIAQAIAMHESTVSRVTSNKYMATNRGIFELKYFFTSAVGSEENGDLYSAEAIRDRIRKMVDGESPDDILSDDRMVEILKATGVDIARRTVAKYREAVHIPSSVQRRRVKKMQQAMDQ